MTGTAEIETENEEQAAAPATALPDIVPIFPLPGAVLLPRGRLPLNIFEPRYLAMIEDAMGQGRMIGMIQPTGSEATQAVPSVYQIGCAGRIISFSETEDGRFLISLLGVCRFAVNEEMALHRGYRRIRPDWTPYQDDLLGEEQDGIDRARLFTALREYFKIQGVVPNWEAIQQTSDENLIISLTMICPFEPSEKQALLEVRTLGERAKLLLTLLEMASLNKRDIESARH
ncbi:MAG: peptidase S16 [Alphaproteobacteria bacterium]|nr:peptidase S16 [Alphaproteobacteria bacterium]